MNRRSSLTPLRPHSACCQKQATVMSRLKRTAICGRATSVPGTSGKACRRSGAWVAWVAEPGLTTPASSPTCATFCASCQPSGFGLRSGPACRPWRLLRSMNTPSGGSEVDCLNQPAQTRRDFSQRVCQTTPATISGMMNNSDQKLPASRPIRTAMSTAYRAHPIMRNSVIRGQCNGQ